MLTRAFGWLDTIEFAIPAILAALLVVVGPLMATVWFVRMQRYSMAVTCGGLWVAAALAFFYDLRRRRCGWGCGLAFLSWLIATLILWWKLEIVAT